MEMVTQRRDPHTGQAFTCPKTIDPAHAALVVIDAWAYHWCITWCGLAGGRLLRLDHALGAARQLGFTIVHCPTDFIHPYLTKPQRQRMAALPRMPLPGAAAKAPPFPEGEAGPRSQGCLCSGTHMCIPNYGGGGIDPRITIADDDLICADGVELFTWCKRHDITHLVYTGFATNICLTGKPEGLLAMVGAGLDCVFARDMTEAHGTNTGAASANRYTAACVAHVEKHVAPTIDLVSELRRADRWDDAAIVDPLRIVPWGFADRPCCFDRSVNVSMTFPLDARATLHYTLDRSEPTPQSPRYVEPLVLEDSAVVRAAAFVEGRQRSLPTECHYLLRSPAPPLPEVSLSDLAPAKMLMANWIEWWSDQAKGSDPPPQTNLAYSGAPLTLRGVRYARGMGVAAPAELIYAVPPECDRFVAQVGLDEAVLLRDLARGLGAHLAARFRVFADGHELAASPIMRLGTPPWPFDVTLPLGSRVISLIVTPAGDSALAHHANWVDAGFIRSVAGA